MALKIIEEKDFEKEVRKNDKVVLVDFFATWCMPCKMLGPVLEQVAKQTEGEFDVVKLDIDQNMDLAKEYGVMSIPTMVVVKDGKEVDRVVGFRQADQIIEVLNNNK